MTLCLAHHGLSEDEFQAIGRAHPVTSSDHRLIINRSLGIRLISVGIKLD